MSLLSKKYEIINKTTIKKKKRDVWHFSVRIKWCRNETLSSICSNHRVQSTFDSKNKKNYWNFEIVERGSLLHNYSPRTDMIFGHFHLCDIPLSRLILALRSLPRLARREEKSRHEGGYFKSALLSSSMLKKKSLEFAEHATLKYPRRYCRVSTAPLSHSSQCNSNATDRNCSNK